MNIIASSLVAGFLLRLLNISRYQLKRICAICKESKVYKGCAAFYRMFVISLRESFLGRISEAGTGYNSASAIADSEAIKGLSNTLKNLKQNFINTQTSVIVDSAKEIKRGFYSFPVRVIGIVGTMTLSTNIALSLILQHQDTGLFWWLARIALLFLAVSGYFCRASWEDISKTSFFLSRINKCCKIGN